MKDRASIKSKVKVEYSAQTELRRIVFTLENTKALFYQKNGFLVLPYREAIPNLVYLPDFNYESYSGFLEAIPTKETYAHSKYKLEDKFIENYSGFILKALEHQLITPKELEKAKSMMLDTANQTLELVHTLFPEHGFTFHIIPTKYGTGSTYFIEGQDIFIYKRIDGRNSGLTEIMLTALLQFYTKQPVLATQKHWAEIEGAVDCLMQRTILQQMFPDFEPTLTLNKFLYGQIQLIEDNNEFLKKLGYFYKDSINIIDEDLFLNSHKVDFTNEYPSTIKLLNVFEKNKKKIISFEQLGFALWGDDYNSFSLQAIAKQIQFLRQFFLKHNIKTPVVKTYRKRGYMLDMN